EPKEAAAWVAYANGNASLFGTTNDITIGIDSLSNNWRTVGVWAKLRSSDRNPKRPPPGSLTPTATRLFSAPPMISPSALILSATTGERWGSGQNCAPQIGTQRGRRLGRLRQRQRVSFRHHQ